MTRFQKAARVCNLGNPAHQWVCVILWTVNLYEQYLAIKLTEIAQQSSWDDSLTPDSEIAASRMKMLVKAIIRIDSVSYGQCTERKGKESNEI